MSGIVFVESHDAMTKNAGGGREKATIDVTTTTTATSSPQIEKIDSVNKVRMCVLYYYVCYYVLLYLFITAIKYICNNNNNI
jgi:hypothetical protein